MNDLFRRTEDSARSALADALPGRRRLELQPGKRHRPTLPQGARGLSGA